jgi:hypothetical protein
VHSAKVSLSGACCILGRRQSSKEHFPASSSRERDPGAIGAYIVYIQPCERDSGREKRSIASVQRMLEVPREADSRAVVYIKNHACACS